MNHGNALQGLILGLVMFTFPLSGQKAESVAEKPRNVILMIGDGMGLSQLSVPYIYGTEEPVFDRFPYIGLIRTTPGAELVTQSSAAATAMATGHKTYNMAVGVNLDTVPVPNLVELYSEKGYMTGLVATSSITDATPAGFYAHQAERYYSYEIAKDLLASEVDYFAGAGLPYFIDTTGRDLFAEHGVQVELSRLKKIRKAQPGDRYGFILGQERMPTMREGRKDFLASASEIGIDFLSSSEGGFFLMIESSQIDWAGHGNQAAYLLAEMNDFASTIARVLEWAEKDGETLLIVTADHETGGFTMGAAGQNGYDANYGMIQPTFASTNHSASMVPLLAFGPGAEQFMGIYENTGIFDRLVLLMQGD